MVVEDKEVVVVVVVVARDDCRDRLPAAEATDLLQKEVAVLRSAREIMARFQKQRRIRENA
jgi:hypothetical protein